MSGHDALRPIGAVAYELRGTLGDIALAAVREPFMPLPSGEGVVIQTSDVPRLRDLLARLRARYTGLSTQQASTLRTLDARGGSARASELAQALGLDLATVTRHLVALQQQGLVSKSRKRDPWTVTDRL